MQSEHRLVLTVDDHALERTNLFSDEVIERLMLAGEDAYAVRLSVEEIVTNLINHSHLAIGAQIRLAVSRVHNALTIVIEDDGQPYDPHAAPVPQIHGSADARQIGGLGIFLVFQFMHVDYETTPQGNRLILRRTLTE